MRVVKKLKLTFSATKTNVFLLVFFCFRVVLYVNFVTKNTFERVLKRISDFLSGTANNKITHRRCVIYKKKKNDENKLTM
ncbi:MAG TPA: hypothetical protein DHG49_05825 [Clostridiales bacterium]|nr:hypothetical protein [Clostridiales bacterium]